MVVLGKETFHTKYVLKDYCKIVFVRFRLHFVMMPTSTTYKIANPSCIPQSTFRRTMLPSKKARTDVQAGSIQPNVTLHTTDEKEKLLRDCGTQYLI
jgi:hypothetical protein